MCLVQLPIPDYPVLANYSCLTNRNLPVTQFANTRFAALCLAFATSLKHHFATSLELPPYLENRLLSLTPDSFFNSVTETQDVNVTEFCFSAVSVLVSCFWDCFWRFLGGLRFPLLKSVDDQLFDQNHFLLFGFNRFSRFSNGLTRRFTRR